MRLRLFIFVPVVGVLALGLSAAVSAGAQDKSVDTQAWNTPGTNSQPNHSKLSAKGKHVKQPKQPEKASAEPSFEIPVTPLGFASPAPFYLGYRVAQASLDFIDEDHILFTFRVPGLIKRETAGAADTPETQRRIRAVVLEISTGLVKAESLWTLHDDAPYLSMLKDKRFLIRDRNDISMGDASLHLDPFLRFPGPVNSVQLDPEQRLLVVRTTEAPAGSAANSAATPAPSSGPSPDAPAAGTPAGSSAILSAHDASIGEKAVPTQSLLRILRMDTREVMLFSHTGGNAHLPVDGQGYYEALRSYQAPHGNGWSWLINDQDFRGASMPLLSVDSTCEPAIDAVAPGVVLASGCANTGGRKLTALTRDKRRLWDVVLPANHVWPRLAVAANAGRIARATLEVTHPTDIYNPLESGDVRGQSVQVYDLADGKLELTAPASPALDGGGNFALSPSGQRFAVLNDGAIQIFNLPAPPAISVAASPQAATTPAPDAHTQTAQAPAGQASPSPK